ncbi:phosphoglycolate phosphatase [Celerinatantimonas diazotrophica]|uniref:Phosphoglycolate phosphatase n=1 Tax=Celerinatantimonas diazotrophica TaxID=412034 RepID=A0A4R1K172_9GAMM|nr:phosphoglycolate phosphatase [Celerinatantimonas diazotrophica]TCK57705.1 phosphoglycolate phosphatase [Celerinatantimonas diazotrophica]CAG9298233.1 Phosphoglycolate phosphatase [Celerinatantimonas diazotrophica]
MNRFALKAVAFDLDGTLIDSGPDLALAINLMLEELSRNSFDSAVVQGWVGNGVEVLIKRALSGQQTIDPNLDDALYRDARARFDRLYAENLCINTKPYPGVSETLEALQAKQIPMAVVTNKPYPFTQALLVELGFDRYFDIVLGGESLPKRKPDPDPLQYVLEKRALEPSQMLMVGDSRNDILAAKAAGCPSYAVTYGYNYGVPIAQSHPDWVSDSICDLEKLFD